MSRPLASALLTSLLPTLFASDAALYSSPLTLSTLTSWRLAAPSYFKQYLDASGDLVGVIAALPLRLEFWQKLVAGELKEWEIEPLMFGKKGGVHVWHVEKWGGWRREWGAFGNVAMGDLGLRVCGDATQPEKGGKCGRWSALVVTAEGERMFYRLGGREGKYRGQVVVGGEVVERASWDGIGVVETWGKLLISGDGQAGEQIISP